MEVGKRGCVGQMKDHLRHIQFRNARRKWKQSAIYTCSTMGIPQLNNMIPVIIDREHFQIHTFC